MLNHPSISRPVERGILLATLLFGLGAAGSTLQAEKAPPDPNCAGGHLICKEVSTCKGGSFDFYGRCDGQLFTIYYYYRGT